MEFLVPILMLLGIGFLIFNDDDNSDTQSGGTAGEGDGGEIPIEPVPLGEVISLDEEGGIAVGTDDDDTITGLGGDDVIVAGGGNDIINAGDGNDTVAGEAGDDIIDLGAGDDVSTNDQDFTDLAVKPSGSPAAGNDLIRGGAGNDRIIDILGSNTLFGDDGDDILSGRDAAFDQGSTDTLFGGEGNDVLRANDGDILTGGVGHDIFDVEISGSAGPAIINDFEDGETLLIRMPGEGPADIDRISTALAENGEDTNVLLDDQLVAVLKGLTSVPAGAFTQVAGGTLGASGEASGGNFNNPLFGTEGADTLVADNGQDAVFAGGGDDVISVSAAPNFVSSPDDQDIRIQGGVGDDIIVSGGGDDVLLGSLGADIIFGNGGADSISSGFGRDVLVSDDVSDKSPDTVDGGRGVDVLVGDDGDVFTGGGEADGFTNILRDVTSAPIIVTDFDPATEALEIVVRPVIDTPAVDGPVIEAALPAVSAMNTDDGTATEIRYGDTVVFVLRGVAAADVDVSGILVTQSDLI